MNDMGLLLSAFPWGPAQHLSRDEHLTLFYQLITK